jgi:hypothetical protein
MEKYNFLKNSFIFPLENKDRPEHQARRLSAGFFVELPLWKIIIPLVKHIRGIWERGVASGSRRILISDLDSSIVGWVCIYCGMLEIAGLEVLKYTGAG